MHKTKRTKSTIITLPVQGGNLIVSFHEENGLYSKVFLKGPAQCVFKGEINI
jgi:diaminopimelate epimerase